MLHKISKLKGELVKLFTKRKCSMYHLVLSTLHNQSLQAFPEIKQVDMNHLLLRICLHTNHKVQRIPLEDHW